ncbi:aconitase family protein, partial [Corynebacterium heidelbergense]
MSESTNSFDAKGTLQVGEKSYDIYRLSAVPGMDKLPYSLKVLGENLLRNEDGKNVTRDHIEAIANWDPTAEPSIEIQFTPARVIMQDFTGVACIVDLATIRDAVVSLGGRADQVNPLNPAEMVIDHSVIIEAFGDSDAFDKNVEIEYQRNDERYKFLRWGTGAFNNFRVVPPGTGIVHQVNIEYLARSVFEKDGVAYPDTCVGTDSHTTMENGLGILGWGVGGIEAEAAMLGQPISMLIPRVVGFKLTGEMNPGVTATDVVLTITDMLRQHGVVGKFVEFYGAGVGELPLANRATIGNMSPEFGSTAAIFPIDEETVKYLELTGRDQETLDRVEVYAKEQGMWLDPSKEVEYSEYLELDLSTVVPSIAGPKRPQDRIELTDSKSQFRKDLHNYASGDTGATSTGSFDAEGPTTETTSEQQATP